MSSFCHEIPDKNAEERLTVPRISKILVESVSFSFDRHTRVLVQVSESLPRDMRRLTVKEGILYGVLSDAFPEAVPDTRLIKALGGKETGNANTSPQEIRRQRQRMLRHITSLRTKIAPLLGIRRVPAGEHLLCSQEEIAQQPEQSQLSSPITPSVDHQEHAADEMGE